jgi:chemotaxis protein MotB
MAKDGSKLQPIIVKKIKKGGHGHHGGAWKIAYADFVTAMMAFFLLMWLLGSTTEGDRKGIADYFNSPLKVALLGGATGAGDASSLVKGGGEDLTRAHGQIKRGDIEAKKSTLNLQALKAEQVRAERERLERLKEELEKRIDSSRLQGLRDQIRLDMTRDGLRIQIVDAGSRPMFASGSPNVQPYMRELLREIGAILAEVPNRLTLEGHTDATAFGGADGQGYTNWELSADRANASRRELLAGGLPQDRVLRVQGLAASTPFDRNDPNAPVNRRISIVVMNRDAEDRFFRGGDVPPTEPSAAPGAAATPPAGR